MAKEESPPTKARDVEVLDDYQVRIELEDGTDFIYDAGELVDDHRHLAEHFRKIRLIEDGKMLQWGQPDRETPSVSIMVSWAWKKTFRPDASKTPRRLYGPPPRGAWIEEDE